eukprot:7159812-Alexandrium_andersonii.AAC.1
MSTTRCLSCPCSTARLTCSSASLVLLSFFRRFHEALSSLCQHTASRLLALTTALATTSRRTFCLRNTSAARAWTTASSPSPVGSALLPHSSCAEKVR